MAKSTSIRLVLEPKLKEAITRSAREMGLSVGAYTRLLLSLSVNPEVNETIDTIIGWKSKRRQG